jgi:hypothetical protein
MYEGTTMNTKYDYMRQRTLLWDRLREYVKTPTKEEQRESRRWRSIYSLYRLTRGQWQAVFERQQGCCAICGISQDDLGYTLEIDYDHNTGKVRGLLCRKCNLGIGMFGEDVENINKAIKYLEKS